MYQDKEKQRAYQREKQRKYRERRSGNAVVTEVVTQTPDVVTTPTSEVVTEVVTQTPVVTHVAVTPGLHTKDDVKPWGWPKYNAKGERINPATMQPYKAAMMAIAAHSPAAIAEYERKRVRKDVLVIADLPIEQRDYLYRCLQTVYRQS